MDNLIVVETLKFYTGQRMVAAPILEDCRKLLRDFGKVFLEQCNRESDMVAHMLAQRGNSDPPSLWLDEHPVFISSFLADDVSVI